jgi:iron complex transport system permease protein
LVSTAMFNALLSMIKFVADPSNQLPDIVFWLLGSFANAAPEQLRTLGPYLLVSSLGLLWLGRYLDLLTIGEDEARSLGVPVAPLRMTIIVVATFASALTVAAAGTIGWVGLIVPHIARMIVGPGHRLLMPVSACLGGMFMLAADTLARSLTPSEIPVGIVADLLGVLLFLCVLPRIRRGWA